MLYAILAYHVEEEVASFTPQEDATLMQDLNEVHERFLEEKRMGPAARLGVTKGACVLRGPGKGGLSSSSDAVVTNRQGRPEAGGASRRSAPGPPESSAPCVPIMPFLPFISRRR